MMLIQQLRNKRKSLRRKKYEPTLDSSTKSSTLRFSFFGSNNHKKKKINSSSAQRIVTSDTYEEASTVCVSQISGASPRSDLSSTPSSSPIRQQERNNGDHQDVIDMDITTSLMIISDPIDSSFTDDDPDEKQEDDFAKIFISRSFELENATDDPFRKICPSKTFDDDDDDYLPTSKYALPASLTNSRRKPRRAPPAAKKYKPKMMMQVPRIKRRTRAPSFPVDLDTCDAWEGDEWVAFVQERKQVAEWVDSAPTARVPEEVADLPSLSFEEEPDDESAAMIQVVIPESSGSQEVIIGDPECPLLLTYDIEDEETGSQDIPGYPFAEDVDESNIPRRTVLDMFDGVCTGHHKWEAKKNGMPFPRNRYAEELHQDTLRLIGSVSDKLQDISMDFSKVNISTTTPSTADDDDNSLVSVDTVKHNNGTFCAPFMDREDISWYSELGKFTCNFFDPIFGDSGGQAEI